MIGIDRRSTQAFDRGLGLLGVVMGCLALAVGGYGLLNVDRYAVNAVTLAAIIVGPIGGGAAVIVAIVWLPKHRGSIGLTVLSSVFGLWLTEAGLTYLDDTRNTERGPIDEHLAYLLERRSVDSNVFPALSPRRIAIKKSGRWNRSIIEIDGREVLPLGGISGVRQLLCKRDKGWLEYDSDEHGFNNPPGIWSRSRVDLALVGDSFVQGFCVDDEESIAGRLRTEFDGVINLGLLGSGPLTELAVLREWGPVTKPRIVVWFFWEGNDFADLFREKSTPLLVRYLEPGFTQGLRERQAEIDAALRQFVERGLENISSKSLQDLAGTERLRKFLTLYNLRSVLGAAPQRRPDPDVDALREILAAAKTLVAEWGGMLIYVGLPAPENGQFGIGNDHRQSMEVARVLGIPIVDISSDLNQVGPGSVFNPDVVGHYGEAGYEIVAAAVRAAVRARLTGQAK